jgi:hypothetical protein
MTEVLEPGGFVDLPAGDRLSRFDEGCLTVFQDRRGIRKGHHEGGEPFGPRGVKILGGFGKIEWQVVGHDTVLDARFPQRDLAVGLGQLLDVVDPMGQRVVIGLGQPGLKHVEDDLGVLRIVLIPGIEHGLPRPGGRHGGDELQIEALLQEIISQGPMVVPGGLEPDLAGYLELFQIMAEFAVALKVVGHRELLSSSVGGVGLIRRSASWRYRSLQRRRLPCYHKPES